MHPANGIPLNPGNGFEQGKTDRFLKRFTFRCYAELNDFLPEKLQQKQFVYQLKTPVTVGEAIESLGIPLSEVDLILVNSEMATLRHPLQEGDYISVYPTFETLDISSLKDKRTPPLRKTRFILDAHLGKLAKYLRMLGFDTLYRNDFEDNQIIHLGSTEERIILTRDKLLLASRKITHGYYVRSVEKHEQLREVVRKFDLFHQIRSFTRCMTCNAMLEPKGKTEVEQLVPGGILKLYDEYYFCPDCRKVFWKGSHFKRMESYILDLTKQYLEPIIPLFLS